MSELQRSPLSISVIIPCLNESQCLPQALQSVLSNKLDSQFMTECIVVDAQSTDDTAAIALDFPNVHLISSKVVGRGAQMNVGANRATGDILLFLHADCILPHRAFQLIHQAFSNCKVVGGSFCLGFDRQQWVLKLCELGSRIKHPFATFGDQGQFFLRQPFLEAGSFREWPLMEDFEIQYRMRNVGQLVKICEPIISSDRRYYGHKRGPLRQQLFNITIVVLYLMGISPHRLARWYRPEKKQG